MFQHTVFSDTVTIQAPISKVWQTLLAIEQYPEWNPFTLRIDGRLDIGEVLDLHVRMGNKTRISRETVFAVDINQGLDWGITLGHRLLLKAKRQQQLQIIDAHSCRYHTFDVFTGVLTPLVAALYGKQMHNGFNAVAYALKARCEELVCSANQGNTD